MHTLSSTRAFGRALVEHLAAATIGLVRDAVARVGRARTNRMLGALSDEQLSDAGLERPGLSASRIEVDARLMRRLMSMQ